MKNLPKLIGSRFSVLGSRFSPAAGLKSGQIDLRGNFYVSVKNSKSQITNNKQITMTKIQNVKPVWVIG
jgi:hypothetical protein